MAKSKKLPKQYRWMETIITRFVNEKDIGFSFDQIGQGFGREYAIMISLKCHCKHNKKLHGSTMGVWVKKKRGGKIIDINKYECKKFMLIDLICGVLRHLRRCRDYGGDMRHHAANSILHINSIRIIPELGGMIGPDDLGTNYRIRPASSTGDDEILEMFLIIGKDKRGKKEPMTGLMYFLNENMSTKGLMLLTHFMIETCEKHLNVKQKRQHQRQLTRKQVLSHIQKMFCSKTKWKDVCLDGCFKSNPSP